MRKDKEKAIQLRRQGNSYKQIQRELRISTGTLAGWFKDQPWSQEIKIRLSKQVSWSNPNTLKLLAQTNKERWRLKYEEYRSDAVREFKILKNDPLFISGLMLYWGKGEIKPTSSKVSLGNSEPEMVKIFNLFLTKTLKITPEKISAWLLLYPDLIDPVQKNFWSKSTGLSIQQFKKSVYIKSKHPKSRLSYGVCTIFINSRALKERILKWLELYQHHLKAHVLDVEKK